MTDIGVTRDTGRLRGLGTPLPLVAVAGLRGKSTVVWLLDAMLHEAGRSAGLWSSTGVYVDDVRQDGELGPWGRLLAALQAGELDVGIQELATPTVTSIGLPESVYPLAAVTTLCGNHEDCLVSPEATQGARALQIVARAVRPDGALVLNADDSGVRAAAEFTCAEIIFFALHHENPALRRHLAGGGHAVWVENGWVAYGTEELPIHAFRLDEAHFTLGGALTFQVQNLLCAVALAYRLDVPAPALRRAVQHFQPGIARLPGSCNIVHLPHATVVVDRARQLWTIRSLVRGIRHQPHRRMVTVAGSFPELPEGQHAEMGRLLGRLGGAIILHGGADDRARIDQLIAGMTQNETVPLILSMPGEHEAIAHALKMLGPSDLGLIVTDDARAAMSSIRRLHA